MRGEGIQTQAMAGLFCCGDASPIEPEGKQKEPAGGLVGAGGMPVHLRWEPDRSEL